MLSMFWRRRNTPKALKACRTMRKVGIVHAESLYHDELRNHDCMPGNHHGCQVSHEYLVSAGKMQFGECKCRQGAGEQLEQCDNDRQLQRVQEILQERNALPYLFIIEGTEYLGNPFYGIGENLEFSLKEALTIHTKELTL